MASHQKLGILLETKMSQKFKLTKFNQILKKFAPKLMFLGFFKQKISADFWRRILTLKVPFWHFLTTSQCVNIKNRITFFLPKFYLNLYSSLENSTTHITITSTVLVGCFDHYQSCKWLSNYFLGSIINGHLSKLHPGKSRD